MVIGGNDDWASQGFNLNCDSIMYELMGNSPVLNTSVYQNGSTRRPGADVLLVITFLSVTLVGDIWGNPDFFLVWYSSFGKEYDVRTSSN